MKRISTAHMLLLLVIVLNYGLSLILDLFNIHLTTGSAMVLSQLSMLVPLAGYCIIYRQNPLKLIRFRKTNIATMILAVFVIVFSYPVVSFLNMISMLFVDNAVAPMVNEISSYGLGIMVARWHLCRRLWKKQYSGEWFIIHTVGEIHLPEFFSVPWCLV